MKLNNNITLPNLFDHEASDLESFELTQNTLLTWLLQWADNKYKETNPSLHSCACDLLELFLGEKIDVNKIEVFKQYDNIDLWFIINRNTVLIIKDKNCSSFDKDQLEKYKETVEDWCNKNLDNYKVTYIYYKAEDYSSLKIDDINKSSFKYINRKDILSVFEKYYVTSNSDLVRDYYFHLSDIENLESEVFDKPFDEIKQSEDNLIEHMKGFCNYFADKIGAEWKFVSYPTKPLIIMFWNWKTWEHGDFFLEFDNFDLKIKITGLKIKKNLSHKDIGEKAWAKIQQFTENHGYNITKSIKMEIGQTLSLATIDESIWLTKDDVGKINKEETFKKMKSLATILKEIVDN